MTKLVSEKCIINEVIVSTCHLYPIPSISFGSCTLLCTSLLDLKARVEAIYGSAVTAIFFLWMSSFVKNGFITEFLCFGENKKYKGQNLVTTESM